MLADAVVTMASMNFIAGEFDRWVNFNTHLRMKQNSKSM
jgi:hypothetical protein